ncbi:hypothetical protein [Pseudoalteromonas phenolica]|uniref:hypothetical protein n=1 Tax=Pseudoalteromonas phenolica TaxID=161398 RepID=UPI001486EF19|nr:hypothetical protein [Pseudoalteromonas phenolica]
MLDFNNIGFGTSDRADFKGKEKSLGFNPALNIVIAAPIAKAKSLVELLLIKKPIKPA